MKMQVLPDLGAAIRELKAQITIFLNRNHRHSVLESLTLKILCSHHLRRNLLQFLFAEVYAGAGHSDLFFASANPMDVSLTPDLALFSSKRVTASAAHDFLGEWVGRNCLGSLLQNFLNLVKGLFVDNRLVTV